MELYDAGFFEGQRDDSLRSARGMVPLVLSIVRPRSVVDVGCGTGTWLSAFRENGIEDVIGIDGDYVDRERLLIPRDRFISRNLNEPLVLDRTFDLAVSLEVAEHLPASVADRFVKSLCGLAPVILFSAAVPEQSGPGHINEQWPWYWHRRFETNGFVVLELRPRLWMIEEIAPWYRQNLYLIVRREFRDQSAQLRALPLVPKRDPLMLVSATVLVSNLRLRATLKRLPSLIIDALTRVLLRRKRNWPWEDG